MDKTWIKKWQEDLEQLRVELQLKHKNLYFQNSREDFFRDVDQLINDLDELDHFMVIVRIAKIIASFRDAHTTLMIPGKWFLPFEFYWFEEGIYIVDVVNDGIDGYSESVNKRVTHINKVPIADVVRRLGRIISHENEAFLKSQLPRYLRVAEVLYGLDVIDDLSRVSLGLEGIEGIVSDIVVETNDLGNCLRDVSLDCELPLFRRNKGWNYWSQYIEEQKLLYINYNSCKDMDNINGKGIVDIVDGGVVSFFTKMMEHICRDGVEVVVVDLRNNLGGNSNLLEPFIKDLKAWKYCEDRWESGAAKVVYAIVGRDTFSSALLNAYSLKKDAGAVILGEASGGKPNCYGEVQYFDLVNSRLKVRYSTKYYEIVEDDNQLSLVPDVVFGVYFKDYINCIDPVMEYILKGKVEHNVRIT